MTNHTVQLNAVLLRFVDQHEANLRAAYALQPYARRFLLPREPGRPLVDPDAEQLAIDVLECARAERGFG